MKTIYRRGQRLRSLMWGDCTLVRDSYMRAGTRCLVKGDYEQGRGWRPVDDFQIVEPLL